MVQTGQDATFYAGERKTLRFAVVDQDNSDAPLNLATSFDEVKWAMSQKDANGNFDTVTLSVEKKSGTAQAETGGNEIDFADEAGTNDAALVELIGIDTDGLIGEFAHQLSGFDTDGEEVILATGTITLEPNLENT